jgi:uncharacterized membrane protein YphA (DoxX/SURF4 family)
MSRYYPGFLAAFFIVLLRIAIGWHFLYEGWEKAESKLTGKEPFSAEIYLRNANGPFAPYFQRLLPDPNGLATLDRDQLKDNWKAEAARVADHFAFTADQRVQLQKILDENLRWADYWFEDPENADKRRKFEHDYQRLQATDRDPQALSYQSEELPAVRRSLEADRRALVQPLIDRGKVLRDAVANLAPVDQQQSAGALEEPWTSLDVVNHVTIIALVAIGACLILGFLTPLAALGAAAFLAMIYLSMPPWPGLPPNPRAEGHYWIVSKNLVEMLACLVIAATPSGHWVGLDALFFGARRRRRLARAAGAQVHERADATHRGSRDRDHDPERAPIPLG